MKGYLARKGDGWDAVNCGWVGTGHRHGTAQFRQARTDRDEVRRPAARFSPSSRTDDATFAQLRPIPDHPLLAARAGRPRPTQVGQPLEPPRLQLLRL
jgi:hypothetical protein